MALSSFLNVLSTCYIPLHTCTSTMFLLKFACTVILSLSLVLSAHTAAIDIFDKRATEAEKAIYMQMHNTVRAKYNAPALVWNDTLATYAQNYVNKCIWEHSNPNPYGENLAAGYGKSYNIAKGIQDWANENTTYSYENPKASHFTQMVWKSSLQLGCAVQNCTLAVLGNHLSTYIVCEYYPKGNVRGKYPANVDRPVS
ncbi:hypothetical protein D9758_013583 [Tetrapyrgos nigripes]|uniref:SCP domain-containing protein n=1 Tax=Tetrapyrgos nigripes TaxID=182062 RepID=A0A8H5CB45_9AGAR|nr:hypothetical protein D9758_013583 [Tetrapyrgos nigripes]